MFTVRAMSTAAWRAANREKLKARQSAYYAANCEKLKAQRTARYAANREKMKSWRAANREKLKESGAAWRAAHPDYPKVWISANCDKVNQKARQRWAQLPGRAISAAKRAARMQRTPTWADLHQIAVIYVFAEALAQQTGLPLRHVDHIIPLQGTNVSGLHVAENLQLLTASENIRKSNRFDSSDPVQP